MNRIEVYRSNHYGTSPRSKITFSNRDPEFWAAMDALFKIQPGEQIDGISVEQDEDIVSFTAHIRGTPTKLECPRCGGVVSTQVLDHEFQYGVENPVMLKATIPVRTCAACEFDYIDHEAMDIKDEVVKKYRESLKG